jgi:hypothetical protein
MVAVLATDQKDFLFTVGEEFYQIDLLREIRILLLLGTV